MFLGRAVEPGEPLWLEEDRDWALALLAYEADQCPGCGHPRSETTRPEAGGEYTASAIRCYGCEAVAHTSDAYAKPPTDPRGLYISARRRDEMRR